MKTCKQYLEELPDPEVRAKALANMYREYAGEWSTGIDAALRRAFLWHLSPEKYEYWKKVYDQLKQPI